MAAAIRFALSNFTITFFVIGLIASCFALARAPKPLSATVVIEALFSYFLLFSIGVSFFYNFIMHTFFGAMSAHFIGWANSPFQAEVGFASLGYAIVGFLAFRGSFGLRLAAIVGPSLFLLGAAGGHIYQIAKTQNLAPAMRARSSTVTCLFRRLVLHCGGCNRATHQCKPKDEGSP